MQVLVYVVLRHVDLDLDVLPVAARENDAVLACVQRIVSIIVGEREAPGTLRSRLYGLVRCRCAGCGAQARAVHPPTCKFLRILTALSPLTADCVLS